MRPLVGRSRVALLVAAVAISATWATAARAVEPFEPFLDGLRRRQMFDTAQAYLESLKSSKLVSAETKKVIPYESARTLVEEARTLRDTTQRMKRLDEARHQFEVFVQANPKHPLAATAATQLGNILLERGKAQLDLSKRPTQVAHKEQLVTEARDFFDRSQKVFDAAEVKYGDELKKFPKSIDPKNKAQVAARDATRLNLLQAKLFSATVQYETSKAYDAGSEPWKAHLTDAAKKFGAIYDANDKIIAGLFARMWQGRCFQDLGDFPQALTYYEQLLVQPDSDDFRDLKRKTLRHAIECWIDAKVAKYDDAIKNGEGWLSQTRGNEAQTPEGLAIRWLTVVAYERQGAKFEGAEKERIMKTAVEHATEVTRHPGEFQKAARELVAGNRKSSGSGSPTNFAETRERAKQELDAMVVADSNIKAARSANRDTDKIPEWERERARARQAAIDNYSQALALRNREVSIDQVNDCRYYLCYLNYDWGRYLDAAVIGEFVARRYPASPVARPCAKTALASYLQAYNAAPVNDRASETAHLLSLAEFISSQWPLETEADEAWMVLGDVASRGQELAKSAEYFNRIRPESPRRGEADLKAGQALWGAYQAALCLPPEKRPPPTELDKLVTDSKGTLERGVNRMREGVAAGGEVTYTLLSAELALAQIDVDTAEPEKAIAILERAENGPLAMVTAKHPLTQRGTLATETYKVALRSYVATQRLPDAERIMNALDKQVGTSPDAAATLTRVYVGLGLELEQQLKHLREENRTDDLNRVTRGFELFLDRIAAREQGNTFTSLNWVGETFYRLGEGFSAGKNSSEAQKHYRKAAATYQKILERSQKEQGFVAPAAQAAVRIRLARCESAIGEYEKAIDQLVNILASNANTLEAQVAAAETFQRWGQSEASHYAVAISGRPASGEEKADIWGWNKLAMRLQKLPKYQDLYRQARYNVADCSYQLALSKAGKEKSDGLNRAAALIEAMARIDPQMGGDGWRQKYDGLLKSIQCAAGRKPDGLAKPPAAATSATTVGTSS